MKISVIIPIYKVEKYLAQCLESIIFQTYRDLEIICVDDGSPDNSAAVYEKYAAMDPRIKIMKLENGGVSAARNAGLAAATGDYVHFMDSDDYLDLDYYEKMIDAAIATDADIATGGVASQNGARFSISYDSRMILTTTEEKFKVTNSIYIAPSWKHMFRREFLSRIDFKFPVGRIFEDMMVIPDAIVAANRMVTVPGVNYHYVRNPGSYLNAKYAENHQRQWEYAEKYRAEFIKKHGLWNLIGFKDQNTFVYALFGLRILKKRVSGDTVRWYLLGLRIIKIYRRPSKKKDILVFD